MKRIALAAVTFWWLITPPLSAATWLTDHTAALQAAKAQNRLMLINFTGSDWCGWCMKLKKEVFDTAEFDQFANSRLVLLEVDFPQEKRQSLSQKQANQALQQKFGVRGYPTLFLVNADGKVLQQLGYMPGGPKAFLGELAKTMPAAGAPVTQNGWVVGEAQPAVSAAAVAQPAVPAAPIIPAAKVAYDKLVLKGVTGSAKSPLALINGKTFGAGDSYKVQAGTNSFKVTCVSIATDHVIVQVEGEKEPRKLLLGTGK